MPSLPLGFQKSLPEVAAFGHHVAREGFEVVFVEALSNGFRIEGHTSALEAGQAWAVHYLMVVDRAFRTRRALVNERFRGGTRELVIEVDGNGAWLVDGVSAPYLDGCLDLDLESTAFTNALPVRRLGLAVGQEAGAPAAYVRVPDLRVERLEQFYRRMDDAGTHQRFEYSAPAFEVACELCFDDSGVVIEYPGLAVRVA